MSKRPIEITCTWAILRGEETGYFSQPVALFFGWMPSTDQSSGHGGILLEQGALEWTLRPFLDHEGTYRAVQPQSYHHEEEYDGKEGGAHHVGDGLGIGDKQQTGTWKGDAGYSLFTSCYECGPV